MSLPLSLISYIALFFNILHCIVLLIMTIFEWMKR